MKDKEKDEENRESKPFPWTKLSFEEVNEHRNFDCSNYRKCLDYAKERYWDSWSCFFCEKFKERKRNEKKNESKH